MDERRSTAGRVGWVVGALGALLALAVAPAAADALPLNSVTSKQIRNREVKKRDIALGAVTRKSIVPGAVDGTNVLDRALHGVDIDRNSLSGDEIQETSLDFNVLQARLSDGCASGEAIRSVTPSGQPTCVDVAAGGLGGALGGDLRGSLPNPLLAFGAVNTEEIADDAITGAKVALNTLGSADVAGLTGADITGDSLGGAEIDEATLGAVPTATNATQLGGQNASQFLTGASNATGDLAGSTFGNLQLGGNVVGAPEVGPDALGGGDIDESSLGIVPNADTLDGINSTAFVGTAATAGGDLGGTFSSLDIANNAVDSTELGSSATTDSARAVTTDAIRNDAVTGAKVPDNAIGTSEVDSSLTAADIADTGTLGTAEINESNLNVIQGAGRVVRGTSTVTSAAGNPDVVSDLPGFGTSDIEVGTCAPNAVTPAATLQLNNTSATDTVLVWELGPISAVLGNTSVGPTTTTELGSALAGVLDSDELLDVYLYNVDTTASARVTIGESTDASNCRFVVEAITSS